MLSLRQIMPARPVAGPASAFPTRVGGACWSRLCHLHNALLHIHDLGVTCVQLTLTNETGLNNILQAAKGTAGTNKAAQETGVRTVPGDAMRMRCAALDSMQHYLMMQAHVNFRLKAATTD